VRAVIKGANAAGMAAALGLAALLLMPGTGAAKGFRPHLSHPGPGFFAKSALLHRRHAFRHRHRQFGDLLPGYGSVMPNAYIEPDTDAAAPVNFVVAPPVAQCRHSRETVTVPSEDGGTREITITRC
jgi:hypothetical protein